MMHPVRMDSERYARWSHFFSSLGIMVVEMTPEEHDRQAAWSQALTHMRPHPEHHGDRRDPDRHPLVPKAPRDSATGRQGFPRAFLDMQTLNPTPP
jgi:hypothetical protein